MNMGMNTGAMMAHLADALPMTRLIRADTITNDTISGTSPSPAACSPSAPFTAKISPRLVHLKNATNCAAKKQSTMYTPSVSMLLPMPSITSESLRRVRAPLP